MDALLWNRTDLSVMRVCSLVGLPPVATGVHLENLGGRSTGWHTHCLGTEGERRRAARHKKKQLGKMNDSTGVASAKSSRHELQSAQSVIYI